MPTTRRRKVVSAPVSDVWMLVRDPHHLPRWWPRVDRVESVEEQRWTTVARTEKGSTVRSDYRLERSRKETERVYSQQLEGTPFERVLKESVTTISLEPHDEGTEVTIEVRAALKGWARFGGGRMIGRATARTLDDALEALDALTAPDWEV